MQFSASRFFRAYFLTELLQGLAVTGRNLFRQKVTQHYPDAKTPTSVRFRGLHALRRYPNGEERCIGCKLCEAACPAVCITIDSVEREDGTRRASRYDIDLFKCIYCGYCEEACPVDAIVMTPIQEFYFDRRGNEVINKEQLLSIGDRYEEQIQADRAEDAGYR